MSSIRHTRHLHAVVAMPRERGMVDPLGSRGDNLTKSLNPNTKGSDIKST